MASNSAFSGSNDVRLSPREWLVAGAIFAALFVVAPRAWQAIEPLEAGPDCRVPYSLGEDYWTYQRYCRKACAEDKILVVGDSVVWGHYVRGGQTLSHYLNELSGGPHYANLGLDGAHPAALAGLVESYGGDIRGKRVVLFCNPLWMSSAERDLQEDREFRFNHPRLVPQFSARIPCYKESFEDRLGVVVQRSAPFPGWVQHLRAAYFENEDFAEWAKEHPYEDPVRQVVLKLPSSDDSPEAAAAPWTAQGAARSNVPWLELRASFQWDSLRRTIARLQDRGNRVFVLVGPLNEHMLTPESLARYQRLRNGVDAWLVEQHISHYVPEVLPSEMYADPSHPLSDGYALLARRLFECQAFVAFRERD
jgi:hypothetical protein